MVDLRLEVGGRVADGNANGTLWIGSEGIDGWWDSAETQFEEDTQQDEDGAFDPTEVYLGPKRVQVHLIADASSSDWADLDVRTWASALAKSKDLGFRVWHAGRWLSLRSAKIRGKVEVRPNRRDMRLTDIRFTVWSPYPQKYGVAKQITVDATYAPSGGLSFPIVEGGGLDFHEEGLPEFPGLVRIANPGTASFYPVFTVRGPMTSFTITSESNVLEYAAPIAHGQSLVLSPYAGGHAVLDGAVVSQNLTRAEWVPVAPGETRGFLFEPVAPGSDAQLLVDYPDGAWL